VILSGWLYVPYEVIGARHHRDQLKARLTFKPRFSDPGQPKEIALYHDWSAREYLGVPRAWGLTAFRGRGLDLLDKTTHGAHEITVPRLPDFNHPRVLDPAAQREFFDGLCRLHATQRGGIAKAATGSGKTVVSLREAGEVIRRPTLILLHLERLMLQWYDEIGDKLGVDPSRIGVVQSDRCEYEGKDFVVGMLHSVAQREYPRAFYRHFGHVIYDEVHKIGTEFFAPVAFRFPSYHWLGLSATVERTDNGETIFFCHLGRIAVRSNAAALDVAIRPVRYAARTPNRAKSSTAKLKAMAEDKRRNRWLADMIRQDYRAGRNGLYVSEYVEHVQAVMEACHQLGIPKEAMGQFTGQRHGGRYCPVVPQTFVVAEYIERDIDEATGEIVSWTAHILASRVAWVDGKPRPVMGPLRDDRGRVVTQVKKTDISDEDLTHAKTRCQLVFATYGMIVEGIDEPRWDAGMDLLPRGKATQLIGRIRRPLPEKPDPYWRTPFDDSCNMSRKLFARRCKDYRESGATIMAMEG